MKTLLEQIGTVIADAFEKAGYDRALGTVSVSNRPDLCEFQCNGAMAGAKKYGKAPLVIAEEVLAQLMESGSVADGPSTGAGTGAVFSKAEAVKPGFLNLTLTEEYLCTYLTELEQDKTLGTGKPMKGKTVVLDYGGPNIAKPLHVGHLRSAVIGESVKRILRFLGAEVTGDIHMGDWGMPMGLILASVADSHPELPYFDEAYEGAYPKEAPFTVQELEEIYPAASARAKEDEDFHARAMEMTRALQEGRRGYRALWRHIMNVSTSDLRRNYDRLKVRFDLWRGESDADSAMMPMVEELKRRGIAQESEGALVVDVSEETDKKEIPPCIILKSDGAALYATSDLATIEQRMQEFRPDEIVYIVDKRQDMHFVQVFRTARKAKLVLPETKLTFIGFGTMNGKDGKPFKTREGGVPRLEHLLNEIEEKMAERIAESDHASDAEAQEKTAAQIGLAALKYGDLSNQPSKDYVFDPEKFTAFEGDTGPYLLYTIVRIKSVLKKFEEAGGLQKECRLAPAQSEAEKALQLCLTGFGEAAASAGEQFAPHRICAHLYALSNSFNSFYHETKILTEPEEDKKRGYIALLALTLRELETGIDLLGFDAPERM
ncbi:MAG: arginine--tRNA ligase [Lachnospiraceae bacterium]|nr:arginine--tRNA ligase [Lachnospiraceae bacterium]